MAIMAVKGLYDSYTLADTQADILDLKHVDDKIVITRVSISVLQRVGYSSENVT